MSETGMGGEDVERLRAHSVEEQFKRLKIGTKQDISIFRNFGNWVTTPIITSRERREDKRLLTILSKMTSMRIMPMDNGCLVSCLFDGQNLSAMTDGKITYRGTVLGTIPTVALPTTYTYDFNGTKKEFTETKNREWGIDGEYAFAGELFQPAHSMLYSDRVDLHPDAIKALDILGRLATTGSVFPLKGPTLAEKALREPEPQPRSSRIKTWVRHLAAALRI